MGNDQTRKPPEQQNNPQRQAPGQQQQQRDGQQGAQRDGQQGTERQPNKPGGQNERDKR